MRNPMEKRSVLRALVVVLAIAAVGVGLLWMTSRLFLYSK